MPVEFELELKEKIDLARGQTVDLEEGIAFRSVEERHLVFGTPLIIDEFMLHHADSEDAELPASIGDVWNKMDSDAQFWFLLGKDNVMFNMLFEYSIEFPPSSDENLMFIQDAGKHLDWMSYSIHVDSAINMELVAGFDGFEQLEELNAHMNSGLTDLMTEGQEMLETAGPEIPEEGVQWVQQFFADDAITISSEWDSIHITWTITDPLPSAELVNSVINSSPYVSQ